MKANRKTCGGFYSFYEGGNGIHFKSRRLGKLLNFRNDLVLRWYTGLSPNLFSIFKK